MNQFDAVRGADISVRSQIIGWNDKVREYLREFFASDIERVQGTEFGDAISKIAYLTEKVLTEPDTFRGVMDVQGRVQAGASVEPEIDHLFIDAFTNAPWNVIKNQAETLKGAATSLMEELVNESKSLGFLGRLKLYSIPRAKQFYIDIGFIETDLPREMDLTPEAAEAFLDDQKQFRETGRRTR